MKYLVMDVKGFERDLAKLAKKYPSVLDNVESLFEDFEKGVLSGEDIPRVILKGNKVFKVRLENPDAKKALAADSGLFGI